MATSVVEAPIKCASRVQKKQERQKPIQEFLAYVCQKVYEEHGKIKFHIQSFEKDREEQGKM